MGNRLSNMTVEERNDFQSDNRIRSRTKSIQEYLRFKYVSEGRGGDLKDKYLQYLSEGGHVRNIITVHLDYQLIECTVVDIEIKVIEESETREAFVLSAELLLPSGLTIIVGKSFVAEKGYQPDWDKILIKWNY